MKIIAENVIKRYRNAEVLKGVSLQIQSGESVAILGASGSGKSTLLSVLSGLEKADGGSVRCDDIKLNDLSDKELTLFRKENVAFIFQQYYLLSHLNVKNNVKLGAALARNADYEATIAAVGLSEKLSAMPASLSGGEQQRVCIARALAKKPKVLFLDEPTGALDEETGRSVLDYILKLQRESGFTMVMVTHNRNIAETTDAVIEMNSGRIARTYRNQTPKSAYEIGW